MDEFNSSDIEFDEPVKPHFKAGMRSFASMTETRIEDRKNTKRMRTLQDTRGAPGSIYRRALWLIRLEYYVNINNITVDSSTGPRAETIMRFIETIVGHIKVVIKGKPAPQLKTIQRGLENLTEALVFKYPNFKISKHESRRIETVLEELAKEGKLLRGKWSKTQWLGVALLEQMAHAWLRSALDQGCM